MPQSVPISMHSNFHLRMEEKPPLCHLRIPKEQAHHIPTLVTCSKPNRLDKNNIIERQPIYNSHPKKGKRWHHLDLKIMKIFSKNSEDKNKAWR